MGRVKLVQTMTYYFSRGHWHLATCQSLSDRSCFHDSAFTSSLNMESQEMQPTMEIGDISLSAPSACGSKNRHNGGCDQMLLLLYNVGGGLERVSSRCPGRN